jgi:hypothetical protein
MTSSAQLIPHNARTPFIAEVPRSTGTLQTQQIYERAASAAATISNSPAGAIQSNLQQDRKRSIQERLFDARASCKITTRKLTMHFPKDWHVKFFKQIDSLMDLDEWDAADEPVTQSSFGTLIRLLLLLRDKRRPGLGIADQGNIVATWSFGARDRLTVECLARDRVRWIVTVPVDGEYDSAAGETSLDRLLNVLQGYKPQHWLDHEGPKST